MNDTNKKKKTNHLVYIKDELWEEAERRGIDIDKFAEEKLKEALLNGNT